MIFVSRYNVYLRLHEVVDAHGDSTYSVSMAYCDDFVDPAEPTHLIDLSDQLTVTLRQSIELPKIRQYLERRIRAEIEDRIALKIPVPESSTTHVEEKNKDICFVITVSYESKKGVFASWTPRVGILLNLIITIITTLIIALSLRLTFEDKFKNPDSIGITAAIYGGSIAQLLFSLILYHKSDASATLALMGRRVDERIAGIKTLGDPEFTLMPWYLKLASIVIKCLLYFMAAGFVSVNAMFFKEQIMAVTTDAVAENIIDLSLENLYPVSIAAAVISVLPAAAFVLSFSEKLAQNIQHQLATLRGNRLLLPDEESHLLTSPTLSYAATGASTHSAHSHLSLALSPAPVPGATSPSPPGSIHSILSSHFRSLHSPSSTPTSSASISSYETAHTHNGNTPISPLPTFPLSLAPAPASPRRAAATARTVASPRAARGAARSITRRRTASQDALAPTPSQSQLYAFGIRGGGGPFPR